MGDTVGALHRAGAIANYMLDRGADAGLVITHLKLQKLVYYAYGWGSAILDADFFAEDIEAWPHGPVVPALWHEFKGYRANPITGRSIRYDPNTDAVSIYALDKRVRASKRVLADVWDAYGRMSASQLRNLTHSPGSPWHDTYHDGGGVIDKDEIRRYFQSLGRS